MHIGLNCLISFTVVMILYIRDDITAILVVPLLFGMVFVLYKVFGDSGEIALEEERDEARKYANRDREDSRNAVVERLKRENEYLRNKDEIDRIARAESRIALTEALERVEYLRSKDQEGIEDDGRGTSLALAEELERVWHLKKKVGDS